MSQFQQLFDAARGQMMINDFPTAEKLYQDCILSASGNDEQALAWTELSWCYFQQKKYEETIRACERALVLNPAYESREKIYRVHGFACAGLGLDEQAEEMLRKSLEIDQHSDEQKFVVYELGKVLFRQQKYAQALQELTVAETYFADKNPEYWFSVLFYLGFIYYYQGKDDLSKSTFNQLLTNTTDLKRKATGLFGLAFLSFRHQDYLNTINLCEQILEYDDYFFDRETIGYLSGASFYYLGRYDIANKYIDRLLETFPAGRYQQELEQLRKQLAEAQPPATDQ